MGGRAGRPGGIDPRRPLHDQDAAGLLACRALPSENGYCGPFWFETYRERAGRKVIDA